MKLHILLLLSVLLSGCSSQEIKREIVFRDSLVSVLPKAFEDSLDVTWRDGWLQGLSVNQQHDTLISFKYDTVTKKAYVKCIPETLTLHFKDTCVTETTIVHKDTTVVNKQETPFLSKLGIGLIGALGMLLIVAYIFHFSWK